MQTEIQSMHTETIQALRAKGIDYNNLKPALVPSIKSNEAGFIFDVIAVESSWYGKEIIKEILPLLDSHSTQSVLSGDLICNDPRIVIKLLEESMVFTKTFIFSISRPLYCVYINNLTNKVLQDLNQKLAKFHPYLGYVPGTHASRAKFYLSTCIANSFLKHRKLIIAGHEDDRPDTDNVILFDNLFEDFGYRVFSVKSTQFEIFLSYKIECPIFKGYEIDSDMALNSVSNDVMRLDELTVVIDENKFGYLHDEKLGSLQQAGIADHDRHKIAELIKSKINSNYIYNMEYLKEHNVIKFNLIIEFKRIDGGYPARMLVSMEYLSKAKELRVITMY